MKKKLFVNVGIVLLLANVALFVVLFINNNRQIEAVAYSQFEIEMVNKELEEAKDNLNYDRVTGFYVSGMLDDVFEEKLSNLKEGDNMAFINLSFGSMRRGLKYINDEYGHYYGAGAIRRFASIVREVYPEEGASYIYGAGSNFFVIMDGVKDRESLMEKAELFKEKWHDTPYMIEGVGEIANLSLYINMYFIDGSDKNVDFETMRNIVSTRKDVMRDEGNLGIGFVN